MGIEFQEDEIGARISFSDEVSVLLINHRQKKGDQESGGMLFCKDLEDQLTVISDISLPGKADLRSKSFFFHNEKEAQKKINEKFEHGYHYVGDWHTHFQARPSPSRHDILTIMSIFNRSDHNLRFMLHVIVPNSEDLSNAYVAVTDGVTVSRCICRSTHKRPRSC